MIAWLIACLFLTIQSPEPSGLNNGASQQSPTSSFWIQVVENQSGTEANQSHIIVQTSVLPEVGAAQFDLVFNTEQLKQPELLAGALLSNALLESNLVSPGRLRVAFVSSGPISGPGELVVLRDLNGNIASTRELGVRLENAKAWKSIDSSEVAIDLNVPPPATPAKAIAKSSSSQADAPVTMLSPSSNPTNQVASQSNTLILAQTTPLQLQVQLTLPGWFTFIAGALTTLVVGSLLLLLMRKS